MLNIKLSNEKPQIYTRLHEQFGVEWDDGVIICDGDTIHCKFQIPPQKVLHEAIHAKQQEAVGRDLWWELYLSKSSFRLEQEVEAYRKEFQFIKENVRDRNQRFEFLYDMAQNLSSAQYGNMVTGDEAMRLIQG